MKLGLDIHGVILDSVDLCKKLATLVIHDGGEVHILTGSTKERAIMELESVGFELNIHYTHLFSIMDYHNDIGTEVTGYNVEHGTNEFPDEEWDKTKGDYCRKHKIDLHLDDSLIYEEYFTTGFARFFTNTNTPKPKYKPKRLLK